MARGKKRDKLPTVIRNPSPAEARALFKKWKDGFSFDIETPSLEDTRMLSIAVSGERYKAMVWDLTMPRVQKLLGPLEKEMASGKLKLVQNGDFDIRIMQKHGWVIKEDACWDLMIENAMRFPDEPVNLSFVTSMTCDIEAWKHQRRGDLLFYNGQDACNTWHDYDFNLHEYGRDAYVDRRMPLLWKLIMPMNRRGIPVDMVRLEQIKKEWKKRIATWKKRAEAHFKKLDLGDLPIGPKGGFSYKKLQELLYVTLALPTKYNMNTGSVSTARDDLKKLAKLDKTGTVDLLIERSEAKSQETAQSVVPDEDGRVRTRWVLGGDEKSDQNEVGKESPGSGRLASRDPNVQNVIDWMRCIYVPRSKRRFWLKADYSQIEMRLIALFSRDKELARAVATDAHLYIMYLIDQSTDLWGLYKQYDFKQLLAAYRARVPEVVYARDETKRIDYGWGYRMGARKMENFKGVPYQRGKRALSGLNAVFPGVVRWWKALGDEVYRTSKGSGYGYLTNPYGRIRRFFTDDAPAFCNFLPQSTAADILYDAMETLEDVLPEYNSEMLVTEHDEVGIDCPDPTILAPVLRSIMEKPIPEMNEVVIPIELSVGRNWAKAHKHDKRCKTYCALPENLDGQHDWKEGQKLPV